MAMEQQRDVIRENFKRGVMDLLITYMLSVEDMYGYQISLEIDKLSEGLITIKLGSLYTPLFRLVEKGFVTERTELVGKKRTRRYYHLTEDGLKYLDILKEEYGFMCAGVDKVMTFSGTKK